MLRISNLHYRYPAFDPDEDAGELPWALAGIDLEIAAGECLGVSGTTGSGKSTLCLALNGLVPQQTGGTIRGDVWVDDWNTKRVPARMLSTRVGLVFQDPEANLLGLSVEDEVAFGAENLAVEPAEIAERVAWALDVVGMSALRERPAAFLSGGQKQRVGIAAVLAMLPQVLVLDEPTAELDPQGRQGIAAVLADLRHRRPEMTVVIVESDAGLLAQLADRLAVLDAGQLVALDTPDALYRRPAELLARGVPVPAAAELALRLNDDLGTTFAFLAENDAIGGLRETLRGGTPR